MYTAVSFIVYQTIFIILPLLVKYICLFSPHSEMKAHEFVVRRIAPYSGSVVFVLYNCPKTTAGDYTCCLQVTQIIYQSMLELPVVLEHQCVIAIPCRVNILAGRLAE